MAGSVGDDAPRELMVLANPEDAGIDALVEIVANAGIGLVVLGDDLPEAEDKRERIEQARFFEVEMFLLVVGPAGWSDEQRTFALDAAGLGRPIVIAMLKGTPVALIGEIEERFAGSVRVAMGERGSSSRMLGAIADALKRQRGEAAEEPLAFEQVLATLVEGSDLDRARLVDRAMSRELGDRPGLSSRLRDYLAGEFSATASAADPARARRNSAEPRGWILSFLLWLVPTADDTFRLALAHLDPEREPDRNVRFWTLSAMIERNTPYTHEALKLASGDPAGEISWLAAIALGPGSPVVETNLRAALRAPAFEPRHEALRALRILSVPGVAPDIIDQLGQAQLGQPLTYDALLALAPRRTMRAALPLLRDTPGYDRLARMLLDEARTAGPLARIAFARIVSALDRGPIEEALHEVAEQRDAPLVAALLGQLEARGEAPPPLGPLIAGYASDAIDVTCDDIGIGNDVETLATVMLAREVVPPLAIGLFGEWGSGKSFYMQSIDAAARRIAERAREQGSDQFCADIVQIHYNAWHYVDSSLWASLVSHLLDGLAAHFDPQDAAAAQARLAGELASVHAERTAAELERVAAADQLARSTAELQQRIVERERRQLTLQDWRAGDLPALLAGDDGLRQEISGALAQVGAPAALQSIRDLDRAVEDSMSAGGRAVALATSILRGDNRVPVIAGIGLVLAAPLVVHLAISWLVTPNIATLTAITAQIGLAASAAGLVLGKGVKAVGAALATLSAAKQRVDAALAAKRAVPSADERALETALAQAQASEQEAAARVAQASARAEALKERIAALQQDRSLGYFVGERSRSEDYRHHLGLISTVRRDFEGLVQRLANPPTADGKKVDRIILYIDDVDRCPPELVVQILQAVHLLLAYPLFVVVVSVDPRWLLRSLKHRFEHFGPEELDADESASPQDYLEKIFQIPFSVRPMDDRGFANMMRRLLAPDVEAPRPAPIAASLDIVEEDDRAGVVAPDDEAAEPVATAASRPRPLAVLARAIAISESETAFAATLHPLLATPRSAKRFANIYRLLKASMELRFEGLFMPEPREAFHLPMLLLAAQVGDAKSAAILFPQFFDNCTAGRVHWWRADDSREPDAPDVARMRHHIAEVVERPGTAAPPDGSAIWLRLIARYSFLTARVFLEKR